jgi:phosphoribosylanthranilate isomerase
LKIKICGITNYKDARLCSDLGVDAIGFIFYKKSKRYVTPKIVKEIVSQLPPLLLKVGVFVNEEPAVVNLVAKDIGLNLIQLHGDESPDYLNKIYLPIIKAVRIKDEFDFSELAKYNNCSFLLDSFNKDEYGGTGQKFDWDRIPFFLREKIILAGGISEKDIDDLVKRINPYAIDISSSVELSPGIKDHKKLKNLFRKIKEKGNI